MRTLLLAVTLCGIVFALINVLPPMAVAGIVFLLISILVHVAGNALGTRLRENGDRPVADPSAPGMGEHRSSMTASPRAAPRTELSKRKPLGWLAILLTGAGLISGGALGATWTTCFGGPKVDELTIAVGVVACAVLGGLAAFLASGFIQVGAGALRQALQGSAPATDETPH